MMHLLLWLLGFFHCAVVDGFGVVGERNADALVSTLHHFPNRTVGLEHIGNSLSFGFADIP